MRRSKYPRGWDATCDWIDVHHLETTSKKESNWTPKQKLPEVSIFPETRPRPQSSVSIFVEIRLESNQNVHWFATWTSISGASHNNISFIHSSMNWPLKTKFWTWWLYIFLTFTLQVRHRDMTVLTAGKLSRYYKLENIRQKAGFSTLTMLVTWLKLQIEGQIYFGYVSLGYWSQKALLRPVPSLFSCYYNFSYGCSVPSSYRGVGVYWPELVTVYLGFLRKWINMIWLFQGNVGQHAWKCSLHKYVTLQEESVLQYYHVQADMKC